MQAAGAPSMYDSFKKGERVVSETVNTFADGIAVKEPGDLTYEIISKYLDDIIRVTEDEIAAAILTLMEKQKIVAEGAGAVSVAAAMFDKIPLEGKNIACVVSGGNIDVNILNRVIDRGLVMSGRKTSLTIALTDKPGQLVPVSKIISDLGANVVQVQYDNGDPEMPINSCFIKITMETKDRAQSEAIEKSLTENGFNIVRERV